MSIVSHLRRSRWAPSKLADLEGGTLRYIFNYLIFADARATLTMARIGGRCVMAACQTSLAFASIVVLLAGCASFSGFPDRPVSGEDDLNQLVSRYFGDGFSDAYDQANASTEIGEAAKRLARNEIINGRLAAFDILFNQYQSGLHSERVGVNLSADAIVVGLGAAGAVVSGGTSQLLSAAAGGVTGLKGAIDRDLFFEKTMPVLLQQMNAQRRVVLVQIRDGLSQSVGSYPLSRGLADIELYYFAGTIPGALTGIAESAGAKGAEAEAILLGKVTSEAVTPEVIDGANKNLEEIQNLNNQQALRLVLILENVFPNEARPFANTLDPGGARFSDAEVAKQYITNLTPRVNRTRSGVEKLRLAIETVKQS